VRLPERSKQVRTLIVNGESAVRAQLLRLCADRPDLDVIAAATCGSQAIDVIQNSDADLLLLDSRLPDMSGYELLWSLAPVAAPTTIMVTSARDDGGRRPAGINLGYLYKPVEPPLFNAAIDRAIAGRADRSPEQVEIAAPGRGHWPPQIIGERSGKFFFLDACEVEYVSSAGNYVVAYLGGDEFLTRATLKSLSALLLRAGFIQIDRSLLVNLRRVAHVERRDRGQYCFVMRGGARLNSTRERSASIRALLLGATCPPQPQR
jgi:DNA-binding LytR/AlgR family response regulator